MAKNNAAYISFTAALAHMFDEAGIEYRRDESTDTGIVENAKWVDFQFQLKDGTMHKLYVPKNKGQVGKCHTTISFSPEIEGVLELPSTERRPEYRNGAIRSHLAGGDPQRVARLIIAAIKRGAPVPQKRTPQPRVQQQARPAASSAPSEGGESYTVTADDVAAIDAEEMRVGARQ